ncbi:hypothetical protein TTHERM_00930710 (macronuclear) [Tetrahymena thermophila SB210]|uniref:Uncharacterized protein n=1 Tax=Tetrahymena thermophila (strain SB210) TaxID=312017 RepID=Q24CH0_TETTS|nr:hypothetical protein TTHERM_00930710 [Tetrahymena thermophila SB210]EAS05490.1 hypothetical protein TTHERM_00930710 [Tetrahymena thermophila SB210]|eukprot:XP_001025735.1 hypothetical protein TTHERM_00930710 [Tetrahymena thermophila SB210]
MGSLCNKNKMEISTIRQTVNIQQPQEYRDTILGSQLMMNRPTLPYSSYEYLDQIQNHINSCYTAKKDILNSLPDGVQIIQNNQNDSGELNLIDFNYLDLKYTLVYQQPLIYHSLSKALLEYKKNGKKISSLQSFPEEQDNDFGYFIVQQDE